MQQLDSTPLLTVWRILSRSNLFMPKLSVPPNQKKQTRQNADVTPRRWSAPQHLAGVSFKLDSILDESTVETSRNLSSATDQRELNDSTKHKFIDCLEDYCSTILQTRREKFVDLKDFKEQASEFTVTLDELEEAKRNAERIAKVTDHAGIATVHVNDAIEAGVLAFAESQVLTRKMTRQLQNTYNLEPDLLLYEGVPEKCVSKFANRVRLERDSQIVEAYVDFKTELKTKHGVLERVETIQKLDKMNELPELKRLRNRENNSDDATRPQRRRPNSSADSTAFQDAPKCFTKEIQPIGL
ncbi:hypothetical protein M3Y97_00805700 [Aphelenchoides bicaudatus]|nr:hypothetical protein M3Y97_00805700 [Aphelenchoides bicaudatus]